jgi:hypothetical protein
VAIELPVIGLDPARGRASVEIIFGEAHLANYRFFLWDPGGKDPVQLAHGNNIDDVLDTFEIEKEPAELEECILSYEIIVQAAEARDGQVFSVTIMVRQEGQVCGGGVVQETGTFRDVKSIIGFRRFRTAA